MCEITEGRQALCDAPAGARKAYLYSLKDSTGESNYTTPPTVTNGAVTAMALKTGKYIHPFFVEAETIEASANSIGETAKGSSAHEHEVKITLMGNTAEDVALASKLIKTRVGVILELNDGSFEIFHYEEGFGGKVQRNRSIGQKLDDMNGSVLTITSRQVGPEAKISSTIVNSLLAP